MRGLLGSRGALVPSARLLLGLELAQFFEDRFREVELIEDILDKGVQSVSERSDHKLL